MPMKVHIDTSPANRSGPPLRIVRRMIGSRMKAEIRRVMASSS
jgi:hypothetical protein